MIDMTEAAKYEAKEMERIAFEYSPLVKAAAARYQGRGAEYDDLVQEGYMALVMLAPRCGDRQWLPLFLKNRLPYHVRDAATRMRKWRADGDEVLLEAIEETAGAEEEKYGEAELRETLRRLLTSEELDMTQALVEGFTQAEIARTLGISQQAVAARLKKIRDKLRPLATRQR